MSLKQSLQRVIAARGPIPIAAYMQQCLVHPTEGYYVTRDPLGAKGDFTTSPEISQMFGELIGVNVVTQWLQHGRPERVRLAELGPGRGTLMADLLRAARVFPAFARSVAHIDLVEASPALTRKQDEALRPLVDAGRTELRWHAAARELPRDGVTTFVVAHEFFDALPVHQFERTADGASWRERLVDYDAASDSFRFTLGADAPTARPLGAPPTGPPRGPLGASSPLGSLKQNEQSALLASALNAQPRFRRLPAHSAVEVCPAAWAVAEDLARLLRANGGGALVADYGPLATIPTNTFRAFKEHHQVDPLTTAPGEADLTADVDFRALADIFGARGLHTSGPVSQADWLHRMGIGARATVLANNQRTDEGRERISAAYRRLVDPLNMGKTYKVLGVSTLSQAMEGFVPPSDAAAGDAVPGATPGAAPGAAPAGGA